MSNLNVSNLDFDSIKSNLKTYLQSQDQFKDYDFEGAGLSILLDILAYNTHYEAIIANQLAQELTLDTAQNSTIVGLHAKRLGYTPKSYTAARASVNLEVISPTGTPATLTLGKGAAFSASVDGNTYSFTNIEPKTISKNSSNRYIFSDLIVYQGTVKTYRQVYDDSTAVKFEIPDTQIDTSTLRVYVQKSTTNTARTEYFKASSIAGLNSTSKAFFVQTNQNGAYEVYFGDDIIGLSPTTGNLIVMEYIVTDGDVANDITSMTFEDYIEGNANVVLTMNGKTYGGSAKETLASTRLNAYKNTMTQDRAVTPTDFEAEIANIYTFDAISVWGGEDNDPPIYGKVFISIKPLDSDTVLTDTTKSYIKSTLKKNKAIVTVTPEFVDVDYLYIEPTVTIYLDDAQINTSSEYIKTLVTKAIATWSSDNLEKFQKAFRFSKFGKMIDAVDIAILSNITSLKISKRFVPTLNTVDSWDVSFGNPFVAGTLLSSSFTVQDSTNTLYLKDDSNGVLQVIYYDNNTVKVLYSDVGTVDYTTGKISITGVTFETINGTYVKLTAIPSSPDIISIRNSILIVDEDKTNVTSIIESQNLQDHQFTSNR